MNTAQDIGNSYGYIYACKTDGTSILFVEANTPDGVRNIKERAVSNAPTVATKAANGKISFTSVGSAGEISSITVGGVQVIGAPVLCTTNDINEYARLVADAINLHVSVPEWTAQAVLGQVILISTLANPDLQNNKAIVIIATAPSIVFTTETTSGGIVNDTEYDKTNGMRYMLNADYDTSFVTNTTPASPTALGNHVEITKYIISRGMNVGASTREVTLDNDTIANTLRICNDQTYIIDTQGSAPTDYLTTINSQDFVEGDEVYIQGKSLLRQTTIVSIPNAAAISPTTQPNIKLTADNSFVTGGADEGIKLRYIWSDTLQRYIFVEMSRTTPQGIGLNIQPATCASVPPAPYQRGINRFDTLGITYLKYYSPEGGANFVDAQFGVDVTAKTGDRECCFQTIKAAYDNAIANGITRIYIASGTYNELSPCLGGGITYICAPDVNITGDILWISYSGSPMNILGYPNITDATNNYVSVLVTILEIGRLIRIGSTNIQTFVILQKGSLTINRLDVTQGGFTMDTAGGGKSLLGEVRINATGIPLLSEMYFSNADIGLLLIDGYTNASATEKYVVNLQLCNVETLMINNTNGGVRCDGTTIKLFQYANCANPIFLASNDTIIGTMVETTPELIGTPTYTLIVLASGNQQLTSLNIGTLKTVNTVKCFEDIDDLTSGNLKSLGKYNINIGYWEYMGNDTAARPVSRVAFRNDGIDIGSIYFKARIDCRKGGMAFEFASNNGPYNAPDTDAFNEFGDLTWDVIYREYTGIVMPASNLLMIKNILNTEYRGRIIAQDVAIAVVTTNDLYPTAGNKVLWFNNAFIKAAATKLIQFDADASSVYYISGTTFIDSNVNACIDGALSTNIYVLDNNCYDNGGQVNYSNQNTPDTDITTIAALDVY